MARNPLEATEQPRQPRIVSVLVQAVSRHDFVAGQGGESIGRHVDNLIAGFHGPDSNVSPRKLLIDLHPPREADDFDL